MKPTTLGLFFTLAIGCGAAPDDGTTLGSDENVAEIAASIVGGTATFARPEVGFLGSCTATLVTTQAFVTAAHCVGYAPEALGGSFLTQRGGLDARSMDIAAIYSRYVNLGPDDLAMGFLAEPPPAWAPGARMVTTRDFGANERGTRMGYGCVETTNQTGQGIKRYRETTTGPVTDVTCPMDSGGPHFKGSLASLGPIYSVASKYDAGPDPGNDTNAFVDSDWVEGLIRWKNGGYEVGLDRYGFDTSWTPAATVAECGALCRKDVGCQAFTYFDGNCHFKSVMGPTSPLANATSGSGVGGFFGDLVGADYDSYPADRDDVCEADCARDSACKAWTFIAGVCRLKNAQPPVTPCNHCRSGYRKNGLEHNIDRAGTSFLALNTQTATQCASACAKDAGCRSFSFSPAKRCLLRNGTPAPATAIGYISGVRRGIEYNTNRAGSVFQTLLGTGREDEYWCQALCAAETQCKAWSFYSKIAGGSPTCHLRDAVTARSTRLGVASGVRGMEYF